MFVSAKIIDRKYVAQIFAGKRLGNPRLAICRIGRCDFQSFDGKRRESPSGPGEYSAKPTFVPKRVVVMNLPFAVRQTNLQVLRCPFGESVYHHHTSLHAMGVVRCSFNFRSGFTIHESPAAVMAMAPTQRIGVSSSAAAPSGPGRTEYTNASRMLAASVHPHRLQTRLRCSVCFVGPLQADPLPMASR